MVSPAEFIPLAEETGLIIPIGEFVLAEACRFAVSCRDAYGGPIQVAVNVSSVQFAQPEFIETVTRILAATGLAPQSLELELTESLLLRNIDESIRKMHALKSLGVRISIDDFGTGYSSLSYLQKVPVDTLKIDRSFVDQLRYGPGLALIRSIVAMAHTLQMRVVVEGVETDSQMDQLVTTGCDELQGYLLGRPEPGPDAFARVAAELDGLGTSLSILALGRALAARAPPCAVDLS